MKIIRVRIEGFGSIIEELNYKFDRDGLNIITGDNGVGKSTIFAALAWGLWGKLIKPNSKIEPWLDIVDENYRGTKVLIEIEHNDSKYQVIRCKDYKGKIEGHSGKNGLFVFKDKKLLQLKGKDQTQKYIIELLGFSFDLFKSSVLFGQEGKTMMEEDGPAKKKILEEAFEASFISRAKKVVEDRLSQTQEELNKAQHTLELRETEYKNAVKSYEQQKTLSDNFKLNQRRQIKDTKKKIRFYQKEVEEAKKEVKEWNKLDKQIKMAEEKAKAYKPDDKWVNIEFKRNLKMNSAQEKLETFNQEAESIIRQFKSVNKPCERCGAKMDEKKCRHKKRFLIDCLKHIKKNIKLHMGLFEQAEKKWKVAKKKLSSLESEKKTYNNILNEIVKLGKRKNALRQNADFFPSLDLSKYQERLKFIKKQKLNIDLKKLKDEVLNTEGGYQLAKADYRRIAKKVKLDQWLLKNPLSNSGLKAYIFNTMLSKLNAELIKYKNHIGFGMKVCIDLESANKDIRIDIAIRGQEPKGYSDLSKGQKKLANLALILALHDTVTKDKPVNILILDEVFESLSKKSSEIVGNILKARSKNKAIHLITHASDFTPIHAYRTELDLNEKGQTILYRKLRDK